MATCLGACWQLFFWRTVRGRTGKSSCCAAAVVCLPAIQEKSENIGKVPGFFQAFSLSEMQESQYVFTQRTDDRRCGARRPRTTNAVLCSHKFVELLKKKKKTSTQNSLSLVRAGLFAGCHLVFFNFLPDEVFKVKKGRCEGRVGCRGPETRPSPFSPSSWNQCPSPCHRPHRPLSIWRSAAQVAWGSMQRGRVSALRGTNGREIGN